MSAEEKTMMIQEREPVTTDVKVVGIDVWWDSDKTIWRKKRLRLDKIPIQYRCPICGAPTGKHPETTTVGDMKKRAKEIEKWNEITKNDPDHPFASIYPKDPANQVYKVPHFIITDPRMAIMAAKMRLLVKRRVGNSIFNLGPFEYNPFEGHDGVCERCYKDGFGYDRDTWYTHTKDPPEIKPNFRGKASQAEILKRKKDLKEKLAELDRIFKEKWGFDRSKYHGVRQINIEPEIKQVELCRVVMNIGKRIALVWMTEEDVDDLFSPGTKKY